MPGTSVIDLRDVGVGAEVVGRADGLPAAGRASRRAARARSRAPAARSRPSATAPASWTVPVMNRRRVTVSPSKAPGIWRSAVYLDLVCLRSAICGANLIAGSVYERVPRSSGRSADARHVARAWRAAALGRRGASRARARAALAARTASSAPQPTAAAPASQTASARSGGPRRAPGRRAR